MKRLFILSLLTGLYILGCEQNPYQIIKGEDGVIYRLNKKTGEMAIIKDDTVVPLKDSKVTRDSFIPDFFKVYDEQEIPGKILKVRLKTNWMDDKLYYEFVAFPYSSLEELLEKSKKFSNQRFSVNLLDNNGFVIKQIDILLSEMMGVVDSNGNPTELSKSSNIDCSKELYEKISAFTFSWALDDKLIPSPGISGLLDKIDTYQKRDYSVDEIVLGLSESKRYPNIAQQVKEYQLQGFSSSDILSKIKSTLTDAKTLIDEKKWGLVKTTFEKETKDSNAGADEKRESGPIKLQRVKEDWYDKNIKSDPRYKPELDSLIREDLGMYKGLNLENIPYFTDSDIDLLSD